MEEAHFQYESNLTIITKQRKKAGEGRKLNGITIQFYSIEERLIDIK